MHRFRTLTKPAYSAARPLQHLFPTHLFGPVPFSSLASEKCERRSVRQFIELSVRAGLWLAKVPSGFEMAYVAVAQAFAFFSICVSIVAMTEKKGLFVSNA